MLVWEWVSKREIKFSTLFLCLLLLLFLLRGGDFHLFLLLFFLSLLLLFLLLRGGDLLRLFRRLIFFLALSLSLLFLRLFWRGDLGAAANGLHRLAHHLNIATGVLSCVVKCQALFYLFAELFAEDIRWQVYKKTSWQAQKGNVSLNLHTIRACNSFQTKSLSSTDRNLTANNPFRISL